MAKTIDNLGLDSSNRYAEDQHSFDTALIKESRAISSQTDISVTAPSHPSEFDLLFELGKQGIRWALFYAPPKYLSSRRRLFVEQLIPALGSSDKQERQLERILAIGEEGETSLEEAQEEPSQEKEVLTPKLKTEKEILLHLLQLVQTFDEQLIDINSRRMQYQKG